MPRTKRTQRMDPDAERATPIEVPAHEVQPVRHGKGKEPLSSSIADSLLEAAQAPSVSISWTDSEEEEENADEAGTSRLRQGIPEEDEFLSSKEDHEEDSPGPSNRELMVCNKRHTIPLLVRSHGLF